MPTLSIIITTVYLFVLIWGIRMARHLNRKDTRRKAGLCTACGYDLRESGDSCPECGEPKVKA